MEKDKKQIVLEDSVWGRIFNIKKTLCLIAREDWKWEKLQTSYGSSYRTYHSLMSKISPLLEKKNLHLYFRAKWDSENRIIEGNKVEFQLQLVVVAVDDETLDPEIISSPAVGQDAQDISKALGKAYTYTKRYMLLNLFSLADRETPIEEIEKKLKDASLKRQAEKGLPEGYKKVSS